MIVGPSPFFRQHHAVEAPLIDNRNFRQAFRVLTKLDQLLFDGAITKPVWRAGTLFRVTAEIVISEDYPNSSMMYNEHGGERDHTQNHRLDARKRLRVVRAALSDRDHRLLWQHVVEDLNWSEIARRRNVHPKTVRRWTIAALNRLAAIPMS